MDRIEERVANLLASPLGCAFLLIAVESGLTPKQIAEPAMSFSMTAFASKDLEVWNADFNRVLPEVIRLGPEQKPMATALMEEPNTAWWFEPVDMENQVWISFERFQPDESRMGKPQNPVSNLERYGLQVVRAFQTSTLKEGTTSMFAALQEKVGDLGGDLVNQDYMTYRMGVPGSVRVYEVNSAQDWHDLCVRYPVEGDGFDNTPDFTGDEGQLAVNWHAAAADWDAVHLSLGGLLTAGHRRVESAAGWTYHWAWDAEQTMWLRWLFTGYERLPDHAEVISPLRDLVHWNFFYRRRYR